MDKVTLSREQLREVVDFIEGRGFHSPHVIAEIIDHFACKVEEKLTEQPGISLERAMKLAHNDFGSLGFSPLLVAYEKATRKKYSKIYWAEAKRLLLHPLAMVLIVLSFYFLYNAYLWSGSHFFNKEYGINGMNMLLLIYFITYLGLLGVWAGRGFRQNKLFTSITPLNLIPIVFFMGPIWSFNSDISARGMIFMACVISFGFIFLTLHAIAMYFTIMEGKKENKRVLDYMESINS